MPFQWLSFQIDLVSFVQFLQSIMSNYDGMVCDSTGFDVPGITADEITQMNTYLSGLTEAGEAAKIQAIATVQTIQAAVKSAVSFGNNLQMTMITQNIQNGITKAGLTQAVANYLQNCQYYLSTGSLYAAIEEINSLIADTSSTKTALSPFVTNTILYQYLNQIQTYLGITVTPQPTS